MKLNETSSLLIQAQVARLESKMKELNFEILNEIQHPKADSLNSLESKLKELVTVQLSLEYVSGLIEKKGKDND